MIAATPRFRLQYFDRSIIRRNWRAINDTPLVRAGLLVRRIARGSIRRRSQKRGKPSPPGTPPRSRQPGSTPPFKMIFSLPNRSQTTVLVGMVGFGGTGPPVPGLQEHGGRAVRVVWVMRQGRDRRGRFTRKRRRPTRRVVTYPPRPFMGPALRKTMPRFPKLWEGSVSRGAKPLNR